MKYVRIFLVVLASLAVAGLGGWLLVGWIVGGAFESAKRNGDFRTLFDVLEASVGSTLARGDVRLQARRMVGEGALAFYQKNPQALERDRKYFETWSSALVIADAARKSEHQHGRWQSSATATWIAPPQRTDSWGRPFCFQSDRQQTIVVSPGPQALSSLDCDTLKVPAEELAEMPQGRLNPHPSGALILFVKTASGIPTGNPTRAAPPSTSVPRP